MLWSRGTFIIVLVALTNIFGSGCGDAGKFVCYDDDDGCPSLALIDCSSWECQDLSGNPISLWSEFGYDGSYGMGPIDIDFEFDATNNQCEAYITYRPDPNAMMPDEVLGFIVSSDSNSSKIGLVFCGGYWCPVDHSSPAEVYCYPE